MSKRWGRWAVCLVVAAVTVALCFMFASKPINGPASEAYIEAAPAAQFYLHLADLAYSPDPNAFAGVKIDGSIGENEWNDFKAKLKKNFVDNQYYFVRFTDLDAVGEGDKKFTTIIGWFRSASNGRLLRLSMRVIGSSETPVIQNLDWHTYAPMELTYAKSIYSLEGLRQLTLWASIAIILALAVAVISTVSFTLCALNWREPYSALWAVLTWIGVCKVHVSLPWGATTVYWLGMTAPAGSLGSRSINLVVQLHEAPWYQSSTIGGEMAVFSFPLGLLYFFRKDIARLYRKWVIADLYDTAAS